MEPVQRQKIAMAAEIGEGATAKFSFTRGGKSLDGFVARFQGRLVAYENKCRHLPLSLDYADNRFFNTAGDQFVCQTHNAIYEPLTGLCVRGPCVGASLFALEIEEAAGAVWLIQRDGPPPISPAAA